MIHFVNLFLELGKLDIE